MYKLFRLIFIRNIWSILTLFLVLLLASTGFLFMRQLTENIQVAVSRETAPLFGADMKVSPKNYTSIPIIETISPYLSWITYSFWERTEFSTTLIDREGKTGLVNVIAYSGEYPQKWILELSPSRILWDKYIAATDWLLSRFASGESLSIDGKGVKVTHTILKSSDLGFSFGSDNNLLILPKDSLSGSMLISSGSRLDQDLLISFPAGYDSANLIKKLTSNKELAEYRIQSYTDRSEQTFETTEELTDYILLILVIAAIFAGIILRSSHDALFADLARTLRIVEILGFSRSRQIGLFLMLYMIIILLSSVFSLVIGYVLISLITRVPEAREFEFYLTPVYFTLQVMSVLILASFLPPWIEKYRIKQRTSYLGRYIPMRICAWATRIPMRETLSLIIGIWAIVYLIFERFLWSLAITSTSIVIFLILAWLLSILYGFIFSRFGRWRETKFFLFDWVRTLVRPLTPTLPITLSLVGITAFFVVFLLFSLSFRDKLLTDTAQSANIYAINILESDRERVSNILSWAEMYSIIRARIWEINGRTLAEHLGQIEPSGEFTREFNVTTDEVNAVILRWKSKLESNEVSVDDDFASRLGVDLWDRIEFSLSGRKFVLTVANIRKSIREGFRPFFYFSFEKEAFKTAPKTYFVSTYASDTELWKQAILRASGPHVTFVDIENILAIAREIAVKILSVISLFFGAISLFGLLALLSLFSRFAPIEKIKSRLYPLFGSTDVTLRSLFLTPRGTLIIVSSIIALVIWGALYAYIAHSSAFLAIDVWDIMLTLIIILMIYVLLFLVIRPKRRTD